MKAVVIAILLLAATVYAKPKPGPKGGKDGPDCGAKKAPKSLKKMPFVSNDPKATFLCEVCLDLVLIAEMYAECEEEYVHLQMDAKCDDWGNSELEHRMCRAFIDEIYEEILQDTEQDASVVCTGIIGHECHYSA